MAVRAVGASAGGARRACVGTPRSRRGCAEGRRTRREKVASSLGWCASNAASESLQRCHKFPAAACSRAPRTLPAGSRMLSLRAMGDSRAPAKDRDAAANPSASAPTTANSPSSRPSGSALSSSVRPVGSLSMTPEAKVTSTAPPATEDIDSEWPSEPQASEAPHASLAPATDEVDSGWLSDGEPDAKPPTALNFPSDPALPSELWGASGAESRRGPSEHPVAAAGASVAPSASAPPLAVKPAPNDAQLASARPAPSADSEVPAAAQTSSRVSSPPVRSRGKAAVLAVAALAAAGLWFSRAGKHESEEPGAQASRPDPAKIETAPAAAPMPPPAPEPVASAPSPPSGVELPSAGAPIEAAPTPSAVAEAPTPAASAESSSGKIVVIVNVRPPQARIYYHGKEAGKAPLRVELEPGKRRSFEVGYPGFMTRKIVVDGSKPEILVGLRPASPYASAPAPTPAEN
jgi:hypothetical protein